MSSSDFHKSKFNICWIAMVVILLGTIIYPITYEHARRQSALRTPIIVMEAPAPIPVPEIVPAPDVAPVPELVEEPVEEIPEVPFIPFERDLRKGDRGADVKRLQEYLNAQGFIVAETGVGSPGMETELFGINTEIALKKFQESNAEALLTPYGLTTGTGFFGEATRALINS